ncbi:YccF domain-containing protein, partial [Salmonella enterica]|uniref:YccF domain-containing protein n=1 Tax=Salmonella enterica TaxID=28901 RepID=UPI0032B55F37
AMLVTLLNVVWFVLGGFLAALLWILAGVIMAITIVGLPWARSCFVIAGYTAWPFGRELISRKVLTGQDDLGTGALGTI